MHGSGNLAASIVFPVADPGTLFTFYGIAMAIIAVLLVAPAWSAWTTRPAARDVASGPRRGRCHVG